MASTAKAVMGIVPGVMSLGLLGESMKMLPGKGEWEGKKKKSPSPKKIVKGFTTIMIGVPLISATSGMVNALP